MSAAELKRRWNDPGGMRLVRAVRSWLTGQTGRPAGLGEVNGRVDLRGIPLTASPVMLGDKDDPSAGVVWESLDLSGAQVESLRFFGSRISNCRFDGASVLGLRLWGTEVSDCSFRRADLRSGGLGTPEWRGVRTVWRRVAFDRAQLRESVFTGSLMEACTFERTSKLLQLQDCEVIDCTFRGKLDTLLVDGRGLSQPVSPSAFSADFREAVFEDSSITGYVLDRVLLPEQANLVVVRRYPEAFRVAAARLSERAVTEVERRVVAFLEGWARSPGAEESDCCFDLGPLEAAEDAGFNEALEQALGVGSLRDR